MFKLLAAEGLLLLAPALLVLPGGVVMLAQRGYTALGLATRALLVGVSGCSLLLLLLAVVGMPAMPVLGGIMLVGALWGARSFAQSPAALRRQLALLIIGFGLLYAVLVGMAGWYHHGLPTGDSQKAIFWAEYIRTTNTIPPYWRAPELLNRDPVDFYTPALHALTAAAIAISPTEYIGVSYLAIIVSLGIALTAAALFEEIFKPQSWWLALPAAFFVLTNIRWLRYVREPGYHYQNAVGELLLFGIVLLALSLIRRWRWFDAGLLVVCLAALALSHQFSMFLAAWLLVLPILAMLLQYVRGGRHYLRLLVLGALVLLFISGGFALGLHQKIPHLFTRTPHLASFIPALAEYPLLLGRVTVFAGIGGLLLAARHAGRGGRPALPLGLLIGTVAILAALTQGPRWGVDIPPVRTLYYMVVPLAVAAAYLLGVLLERLPQLFPTRRVRMAAAAFAVAVIVLPVAVSVVRAWDISHTVSTNSTLTPGLLQLAHRIRSLPLGPGALLIDDANRRAGAWLTLSGRAVYSRLGGDIGRQQDEAEQSPLRAELFTNQLRYEKVFALGSRPDIAAYLPTLGISAVAGTLGSSASAFAANPALVAVAAGDDTVLFAPSASAAPSLPANLSRWLFEPTTLANDIGDAEDTFLHLMASLRATRLSNPTADERGTFRTTTAPRIPITFNVGGYAHAAWADATEFRLLLLLRQSATDLALETKPGSVVSLAPGVTIDRVLTAADIAADAKGLLTVVIHNPLEQPVVFDLIAIGLTDRSY